MDFNNIDLNAQFLKALKILEETRKSVFITGKAGTGKSTFLEYFRAKSSKKIVVLASTGVAAVNIGGQTIHSFFRFKPGITFQEARNLGKKLRKRRLYREVEVIVIDEISMVRADLLDCVDVFLKSNLSNQKPFGGKQMVFIGDLYQLPPVTTKNEKELFSKKYSTPYFFSAKVMLDFDFELLEFEKYYRQKDKEFIEILNAVRNRTINEHQLEKLNQRLGKTSDFKDKEFIYLTSVNALAEKINRQNLEKLPDRLSVFKGEILGDFDEKLLPTAVNLELKEGAQVMLLNNDSRGRWVNGTLGKAVKIKKDHLVVELVDNGKAKVFPYTWEIIEAYFDTKTKTIKKRMIGSFIQFPVRLAWAITIHKSQGKTFDRVLIDLSRGLFSHGQLYVALSRCRTLNGIVLTKPIKKGHILLDYRIVKFLTDFHYRLSETRLSSKEKEKIVKEAIDKKKPLQITYLKPNNEKSQRKILPKYLGEIEYLEKKFYGIEAFCFKRGKDRVFRLDRILKIKKERVKLGQDG